MVPGLGPQRNGGGRPAASHARRPPRQFARMAQLGRGQRVPCRPRPNCWRAWRNTRPRSCSITAEGGARLSETLEPALPDHLDEQAERLMRRLCDEGLTVATAESCTGGMLAAPLTDIEGAGRGFDRGFVTYTKDAKHDLLGIDRDVIDKNDAVSEVVARAMAEGGL